MFLLWFILLTHDYKHNCTLTASVKSTPPEQIYIIWEDKLSEHEIRGRIGVSAAGSQGEGSRKRSVFSQTQVTHKIMIYIYIYIYIHMKIVQHDKY